MNKVTLIGSTRFKALFYELKKDLEAKGLEVHIPGILAASDEQGGYEFTKEQLATLIEEHHKNIENSDIIITVSKANYIGESTRKDITHAKKFNKLIFNYNVE